MCDSGKGTPITAYKVQIANGSNWCAFDTLQGALDCIKDEMEMGDGAHAYVIEPWETTEDELYRLPEHDGDFS